MSFADRTEAQQAAALAGLARSALTAWDLADARLDLIKYRENAVFRVTRPDGARHVLRVHRPGYRSDAHIRSEAAWTAALSDAVLPTPRLLPTRRGELLVRAQGEGVPEPRQCDLLGWVDGEPIGTLEGGVALGDEGLRRTYETVGSVAARLHAHGERWSKPPGFTRPAWDIESLVGDAPAFGPFEDLAVLSNEQRALLLRARARVRQELAALGPPDLLIHGDLIPDNLLVAPEGIRVIDFDDCGWSWCGFELVTSIFPLQVSGGFEVGLESYLAGYRSVRALPESELEALPALLLARGLSYLGWPAGRPEIHAQRALEPFLAKAIAELAERYLAGSLG